MITKIAINGYGRIGKNILRALYKRQEKNLQVVGINDLGSIEINTHLTKYDSIHGIFDKEVSYSADKKYINIEKDRIQYSSEADPKKIPWQDLDIDIILECSGFLTSKEKAKQHLINAKKVLISAPATNPDFTTVYGINHHKITPDMQIISNASCTTNCLAVVAQPIQQQLGIESGFVTTVHAYTNDQKLIDSEHSDMYRSRSAAQSLIPTSTGAAKTIGSIIPELDNKLDGIAVRVPTPNVSLLDCNFILKNPATVDEINDIIINAAKNPEMQDILTICENKLVSIDFNCNSSSAIFDTQQTKVQGNLVKIIAWYDNETGFSNRMIDCAKYISKVNR